MFKIALQTYSVRDEYQADLKSCLKKVKGYGYEGVEPFGAISQYDAVYLRDAIHEAGLEIAGYHTMYQEFETPEKTRNVINYMRTLGNNYVIIPSAPAHTVEEWETVIKRFNEIHAELTQEGFKVGFHAHANEMKILENGSFGWEMVAEGTPDDFIMQIDMGNTLSGGMDPYPLYQRYVNKGETLHFKPYLLNGSGAVIGEDDIDWKGIIDTAKNSCCVWAIVEVEAVEDIGTIGKQIEGIKKLV